ncbi:putative cuticle collagen 80 [Molothrus aeneus]|uniref:putative cuticle collagen 80 n=1 Tax=Molothrus aeneus TaxID=84833 RepID=UPI0034577073
MQALRHSGTHTQSPEDIPAPFPLPPEEQTYTVPVPLACVLPRVTSHGPAEPNRCLRRATANFPRTAPCGPAGAPGIAEYPARPCRGSRDRRVPSPALPGLLPGLPGSLSTQPGPAGAPTGAPGIAEYPARPYRGSRDRPQPGPTGAPGIAPSPALPGLPGSLPARPYRGSYRGSRDR